MEFAEVYTKLFNLLHYFGLAPFKFSKTKFKMHHKFFDYFAVILSFLIICVITLLMIAIQTLTKKIFGDNNKEKVEITGITLAGQNLHTGISTFCYIGMIILSAGKKSSHMKLFNTLMSFDREILEFFQYNLNYRAFKKRINIICWGVFTYNFIISICSVIYLSIMKISVMTYRVMLLHCASQTYPQIYVFHYCAMCCMIKYRFKAIENLAKSSLTRSQFENLVTINMRLRHCVYSLNDALGMGQFLNIMNNSISLTVQIFLIVYMIFSPNGANYLHWNICTTWFFFFNMMQTIFVAKMGSELKEQVLNTNKAMSENTAQRYQGKETEILSGCPLDKLYGHKLECSAGGFFVIDYSLIMMMISTVTAYLVILLQFNQDEN